jgi:hypothetical protein
MGASETIKLKMDSKSMVAGSQIVLGPGDPPLTKAQLLEHTRNGERYIDVVVPVRLTDLIRRGTDWLDDYVSELITGGDCDLEDISYEPHHSNIAGGGDFVLIRVVAHWAIDDLD